MRLLIVDGEALPDRTESELEASGIEVERAPQAHRNRQRTELAAVAEELLGFERLLMEEPPDGIVLGSASSAALAATLAATKAGVPVVRVDGPGADDDEINRTVLDQLVDATLARDPDALVSWARDT